MTGQAWDEMLAEFRALGGIADNICLRDGEHGRGVFPIDAAKPVAIHVPENLLISRSDARFVDGKFRLSPESGATPREIAFIEHYENQFSWGDGGRRDIEYIFEQTQSLPQPLRQTLKSEFHLGDWFDDPNEVLVQEAFLDSRNISYRDKAVLMPVLELVNHDPDGSIAHRYQSLDGLSCRGVFSGEVVGRYTEHDSIGVFINWGFACAQPQAFSVPLQFNQDNGLLQIDRDLSRLSEQNRFWIPKVIPVEDTVKLEFLMMGNRRFPRTCRGIFNKVAGDMKIPDPDETFDLIRQANIRFVTALMSNIETVDGPMAQTLRRVARYQLEALSNCFGVREV